MLWWASTELPGDKPCRRLPLTPAAEELCVSVPLTSSTNTNVFTHAVVCLADTCWLILKHVLLRCACVLSMALVHLICVQKLVIKKALLQTRLVWASEPGGVLLQKSEVLCQSCSHLVSSWSPSHSRSQVPIVGDNAIGPPWTCEIPCVWHRESALGRRLAQRQRDRIGGDKLAVELFF